MFLAVSGMVGVGKTTLATALAERLGYALISERGSTNPYLDDYYADFRRWSFNVQVFFLAERFRGQLRVLRERTPHVQDRTIYEDAEIFARLHFELGNMDARDYATYRLLYETLLDAPAFPHPDLVLYLTGTSKTSTAGSARAVAPRSSKPRAPTGGNCTGATKRGSRASAVRPCCACRSRATTSTKAAGSTTS